MNLPPSVCVTVPQHDGLSLLRGLGWGLKGPCKSGEIQQQDSAGGATGEGLAGKGGRVGRGQTSSIVSCVHSLGVKEGCPLP